MICILLSSGMHRALDIWLMPCSKHDPIIAHAKKFKAHAKEGSIIPNQAIWPCRAGRPASRKFQPDTCSTRHAIKRVLPGLWITIEQGRSRKPDLNVGHDTSLFIAGRHCTARSGAARPTLIYFLSLFFYLFS